MIVVDYPRYSPKTHHDHGVPLSGAGPAPGWRLWH